jgi:ribosomal protein S1
MRALEKDPWSQLEYKTGDTVKGVVHRINHFGAFIYLNKDIHGLAHVSEMSEMFPGKNINELIKLGGEYFWKILSIEPKEHRMGLVLVTGKAEKKEDKEEVEKVKEETKEENPAKASKPKKKVEKPTKAEKAKKAKKEPKEKKVKAKKDKK